LKAYREKPRAGNLIHTMHYAKNWVKYDEFATNDSPVVQSRKYLEDYEKAKESGQPLTNDHVRIALEAKRQLGLPIDESDYADLQTKETKLREVTNMENYVKNAASSYGRDSGAMMEEMLKLNGCSSVAELQEKVANGEKIIEAVDTAWSKDIQKLHYAGYDAMIAARNAEASLMNLNASLRGAELGTHGDTNALWAKQNIQGGKNDPLINPIMSNYINLFTVQPWYLVPQIGIKGHFAIATAYNVGVAGVNWGAGNGDDKTFTAEVVTATGITGASIATGLLAGKITATISSPIIPIAQYAPAVSWSVGFATAFTLSLMGYNEEVEKHLRNSETRQLEYIRYQNQRFDYMKNIKAPYEYSRELNWNMRRIREERMGNYWTGVKG